MEIPSFASRGLEVPGEFVAPLPLLLPSADTESAILVLKPSNLLASDQQDHHESDDDEGQETEEGNYCVFHGPLTPIFRDGDRESPASTMGVELRGALEMQS